MSVYNALILMLILMHEVFAGWEPDCENLIEPVDTNIKDGYVDNKNYWQKRSGQPQILPHVWFSPKMSNGLPLTATQTITVFKCSGNSNDDNCVSSQVSIPGAYTLDNMENVDSISRNANFQNRVSTCMPWQGTGGMTHLLKQFTTFKVMESVADSRAADYGEKYKSQSERVPPCEFNPKKISFLSAACSNYDSELVFLKPNYKFHLRTSSSKEFCIISHDTEATADVGTVDYPVTVLNHIQQKSGTRQWTQCQYIAKHPDWLKYLLIGLVLPETTKHKKVQFYDYNLVADRTKCIDFVSASCVDNAFSFVGQQCRWVHQSSQSGLSMKDLLQSLPDEYAGDIMYYGAGEFTMNWNFETTKIMVYVSSQSMSAKEAAGSLPAWNGYARQFRLTDRFYVDEKRDFSCSGCPNIAQAPATTVLCSVPQQCRFCDTWQRVVQNGMSTCDPSFPLRACTDCKQHHVRSGATCSAVLDRNERVRCFRTSENSCDACPALEPMRRSGDCPSSQVYCGDTRCTECNHTQYFDATNANGCLYFMSVVDGLTFTPGQSVRFNRAYVDEYKPVGSLGAPEAVPALQYRNLMQDGNEWDASSVASNCEGSMFYDSSYPGILTRNVWGYRMQYRRWCGHDEISKDNDAQLQLVAIRGYDSAKTYSTANELPSRISLQDANRIYVIKKERTHFGSRVGELKITSTTDALTFYYEIQREGRTDDCTYCNGTFYTKDCGPTYSASLNTPQTAGPGTCQKCDEQCFGSEYFFDTSEFSCWSNGTSRVSSNVLYGSVRSIGEAMSTTRNYWYKPAICVACKKLSTASVPQIVTRCGNKVTFEVWHPTLQITVLLVNRPRRRACCAIDSSFTVSGDYTSDLGTRCVTESIDGTFDTTKLASGSTPLCQTSVPDLSTASMPFCPPGWFLDKSVAGCTGQLETWNQKCCAQCSACATQGSLKTNEYKLCSGDTAEDTQLAGCVTSCAEKNYQLGNDTCVECESCG